jgi:phage/plasmid-like protein (TIGR03299 family)
MMYVGDPPWHKLGTAVRRAATAEEAITAASLDWEVAKLPLFATNGQHGVRVAGKYATVRADMVGRPDCGTFGIVDETYTPLQNREAFAFFDSIVRDQKAAIYHTAGALGRGERVWILAKLPDDIVVAGRDITNKFLLLTNNHDGRAGVRVMFTPIRVVCQNTLTLALSEGGVVSVPHLRDVHERLLKAAELLGVIRQRFDDLEETFNGFAAIQLGQEGLRKYLEAVFPDPHAPDERAVTRAASDRLWSEHFFAEGEGNREPGVAGTLWAAYNGITELVDHRVSTVGNPEATNPGLRRLNNVWFGTGASVKARAYRVAVEFLDRVRN